MNISLKPLWQQSKILNLFHFRLPNSKKGLLLKGRCHLIFFCYRIYKSKNNSCFPARPAASGWMLLDTDNQSRPNIIHKTVITQYIKHKEHIFFCPLWAVEGSATQQGKRSRQRTWNQFSFCIYTLNTECLWLTVIFRLNLHFLSVSIFLCDAALI